MIRPTKQACPACRSDLLAVFQAKNKAGLTGFLVVDCLACGWFGHPRDLVRVWDRSTTYGGSLAQATVQLQADKLRQDLGTVGRRLFKKES